MGLPPRTAAPDDDPDAGFLSRWSRRKLAVRQGAVPAAEPALHVAPPAAPREASQAQLSAADPARPAVAPSTASVAEPAPTLADVAALGRDSDYARFVAPGVASSVKNAALKKLFTDPRFNVMDRLDTYIDDYGLPDPLPEGMLRQMTQSRALGLFSDEEPAPEACTAPDTPQGQDPGQLAGASLPGTSVPEALPGPPAKPETACDEDLDLRLQPHPAAGPSGTGACPVPDAGREH